MSGKKAPNITGRVQRDHRRQIVASLAARGMSERQIHAALQKEGVINHKRNKPYSLGIIASDMIAIREEWRERAQQSMDQHIQRDLADLEELQRAAYAKGNLAIVARAIELRMKLLGSPAPERIQADITTGGETLKTYSFDPTLLFPDKPKDE